ncbi:hypothetical protein [Agromyces subbeticus]|uniref:hypothetical protein n=1 Tax=Agromyces subbeticus TaxID=293890 RepID=UPI0012EB86A9|nr:hypothetical protein [Agromyces subbeticus]
MKAVLKKLAAATAIGAALSLTMIAAPAQAVVPVLSSNIQLCRYFPHDGFGGQLQYSDGGSRCAQVYTNTNLNVRTGPGAGYSYAGYTLTAGKVYEFDCWSTGSYVDGDNIWLKVYTAGGSRWVSDRYVYTGANVTTTLQPC